MGRIYLLVNLIGSKFGVMKFKIAIQGKKLNLDSDLKGLTVNSHTYHAGKDGKLIYDQVKDLKAQEVTVQMSTNTSTLIPALRILSLPYNKYFDRRAVVESQNNITFYWDKSRLAAYYNKYSTDSLEYSRRPEVIKKAVKFLVNTCTNLPINPEYLSHFKEPCKLLGFYEGFPVFDSAVGLAKLRSRLGIHIGPEDIMISTPLDKYEEDVYEVAEKIAKKTGKKSRKKKNRVVFEKSEILLNELYLDS